MADEAASVAFVLEVEKYPCLYNFNLPEYCRRDITEKAWSTIAEQLNTTVLLCKEKWRNLRSVYLRRKKVPKFGEGRKSTKPYYLDEYMKFLHPYLKTVTSVTNNPPSPTVIIKEATAELITQQDDTGEEVTATDEPVSNIAETTSCKRPGNTTPDKVHRACTQGNHRKYFLLSLLPEINELTKQEFKNFRRRLLMLLDDVS